MAKYTEVFKRNAVAMLREVREKGFVEINKDLDISNVRDLVEYLGVTNYAIYSWDSKYENLDLSITTIPKKAKTPKPKPKKKKNDLKLEESSTEESIIETIETTVKKDTLVIGSEIRLLSLLASIYSIPNYSKLPLKQLQLKLGLEFLKRSGLIDSQIKKLGELK